LKNKVLEKCQIKELCIFILFFAAILSNIILNPINDLDEIWNYNFARNISNGLVPYRDFNMIITPFTAMITGIILKITCDELIIMRFMAAILGALIMLFTYKIFIEIKIIRNEIAFIFTSFIYILFKDLFCIDYNFATLLCALVIIYIEIKQNNENNNIFLIKKNTEFWIGVLAGISLMIKQTSGATICIIALGNKLLFVRTKEQFKAFLKFFLVRIVGMFIPIFAIIIYLLINNAFKDFISYTINGVSSFNNFISYKSLLNWNSASVYDKVISVLAITIPLTFVYSWYLCVMREKEKNSYFILVYGLATFVITFPISNCIHFLIGALPWIIILLYEIYKILYKIYLITQNNKKKYIFLLSFVNVFIILTMIFYIIKHSYNYIETKDSFSESNHYRYIIISKELEMQIKKIDNYIKSSTEKVLILDSSAAIYMIPINQYNKDYDMFNNGNFGKDGEQRLKKDIINSKNVKYLVLKDEYKKNWQTPLSVIEELKSNKRKIDEIEIFDIYE
jgi:hypothetical protein